MSVERLVKIGILAFTVQLLGCGQSKVSFSSDVQPIFEEHCIECHTRNGEGVAASGFSVQDYDSVMKGTDLGPVVVSGSAMSSTLYLVVAQKTAPEIQMPPQHPEAWAEGRGSPLSDDQVEIIQTWIDQGAKNN
jgi:mono/diheme cytochrome c family protein